MKPYKDLYKSKAWVAYSKYIRTRDCLETTHRPDWGKCFTCQIIYHIDDLEAGHFVSGRGNAVLFDERMTHAQCKNCNQYLTGNSEEYIKRMIEIYGKTEVENMKKQKWSVVKYVNSDYQQFYKDFKKKTENLIKFYQETYDL